MAITENAKQYHEKMFPRYVSDFLRTAPEFIERFDNFAFDEVVNHPKATLDDKTRFMVILATLLGCQGIDEFQAIVPATLNFGVTPVEIKEIVYQAVAYLGIGRVFPFLKATNKVLEEQGVTLPLEGQATTTIDNRREAGFDVVTFEMDLSLRQSIKEMVAYAQTFGDIKYLVNGAGVSPSQASIETVLKVDLYGTSVLLEEVGKVIAKGGAGVTISSQSGHRMPALTAEQDLALAMTPTEELLSLDFLQENKIENSLHAYQLAKRANEKRTMYEAVRWGERGARINDIAPGIIVTPLAIDEFNGIRGDFYKNMFAKSPAGRPGTADEVADVAELLMSERAQFITGSTFLIDGGATASYFYELLNPNTETGMAEGKD